MNFDFIKQLEGFNQLYNFCHNAECYVFTDYNLSVSQARCANEFVLKFIYAEAGGSIEGKTTFDILNSPLFIDYIDSEDYINSMHFIRKKGNIAVHQGDINKEDALNVLFELHYVVCEFLAMYEYIQDYEAYVEPKENEQENEAPKEVVNVVVEDEIISNLGKKMKYTKFSTKHKRDEKENKKLFISASLTDSGWPVVNRPNTSMPCSAGINMMIDTQDSCDYILYGKDNKPLAIIEYTETINNLYEGRIKACDKAAKLEKKYGYKPVVYYTTGYQIYCIDQLGYEPRRVFNFHTIDELEWLLFKRTNMKDISSPVISDAITNRKYQKEAINAICKAYSDMRRKSLLVLATGTGKTRVSISTVEILMKAGWVKNVLFLADRTSLVKQAHKNYNKLLPNVTTSIYTGDSQDKDSNAKIIFSTYQSMINLIDEDTKEFSIGRFDLIVIDEAHRSIFKKYKAIFDYFDCLMLGLTATPRNDENKSTYEIFNLPGDEPDYAYELEEAIKDKYLVGFTIIDKTTEDLRRGVKYSDLSEEEKKNLEDIYEIDKISDDDYLKLSGRLINTKTIDIMLNELMNTGLKINGGDTLGKTIIFAKSHIEAEVIVKRFNVLYGKSYHSDFCKLIDSHVENNQNLIEKFEERDTLPNIVVSVDMLDTGIDVPDILNLVFFKSVQSKIKFLQMIGRGTRLSPDIFGPSLDKKGFIIFDYYDNFEYFSQHNTWSTIGEKNEIKYTQESFSSSLNTHRLNILQGLEHDKVLTTFEKDYLNELKQYFIDSVQSLVNDNISVQMNMAYVNKYRTAELWDLITDKQKSEIISKIIPLIPSDNDKAKIKSFDKAMLFIEEKYKEYLRIGFADNIIKGKLTRVKNAINFRIEELMKLKSIPDIMNKMDLLEEMYDCKLIFDNFSLEKVESVRKEMRGLMTYLPDYKGFVIIDHEDYEIIDPTDTAPKEKTYKEKIGEYLADTKNPILAKIMNLDELTKEEQDELENQFTNVLGSVSDFKSISKGLPLLPFIRLQVGFTDAAVSNKFSSFLNSNILDPQQLAFCNQIIDYTRVNGDFTPKIILTVSPFSDMDVVNLFGTKFSYVKQLISGLHKPVEWKN